MNKNIRLFSILLSVLLPLASMAGGISASEALLIAKDFMKRQGKAFTPDMRVRETPKADDLGYYVFNGDRQTGFVIVCSDDRVAFPVLGYSVKGSFDYNRLPPNAKEWMDAYTRDIKALDDNIEGATAPRLLETGTAVEPLLTTTWGQGDPYNQQCPQLNGLPTLTGCGATALAQIMYYHQWPAKGKGSISYTWESTGKRLSRSFTSSTYNWGAMTTAYDESSSAAEKAAVAMLMRDCGYAQKMDYGVGSSGSYPSDVPNALTTYFGYDKNTVRLVERGNNDDEWESMLRNELDNRRPVFYVGYGTGGHAFVCDGYDQEGYFHFNFGWNGNADGYFAVTAITPRRSDYSYCNVAIVGIRKPDVAVSSVRLNKSTLTIMDDETAQLTATVLPATATDNSVMWSSSDESIATVDENGLVTPGSVIGTATITCTSVSTPTRKATCKVTVKTTKQLVTVVRLDQTTLKIKDNGEAFKLNATVVPDDAYNKTLKWESSNPAVATVDEEGNVSGHGIGIATITCSSKWVPVRKATSKVTVVDKNTVLAVTGVKLDKTSLTIKQNETGYVTSIILPAAADDREVVWTISNPSVATITTDGNILSVEGKEIGTAILTCQSVSKPAKKATCKLTVKDWRVPVTKVTLDKTTLTLGINGTYTLKLETHCGHCE